MKQLTIKQKAQRYDETIERAKKVLLDCTPEEQKVVEYISPELKESEDEKIRKSLIHLVHLYGGEFGMIDANTSVEKAIAWLEKQGESELSKDLCEYIAELSKQFPEVSFAKLSRIAVRVKNWLEKQVPINEEAEKEKNDYVSGQFLYCKGSFNEFKEGESYWIEYIGNDTYIGRSDNILNQKFHITPRQLYTWLDPRHPEKQGEQKQEANYPKFDFNDILALQCCMETVKKVQEDKELYGQLQSLHDRLYDAYRLEKQGNHKPIDKIQLGKKYKCIASPRYSTFRRGNIYKPVDNFLCNLMNLCYECFEPIEDSEQKPADKVEPKFKVGDWITNGDYTWKIVEVKSLNYILQSQDGNIVDDTISYVDKDFRCWTIQDAKPGNVLIDKSGSRECPFIFKETKPSYIKTDVPNPLTVLGYCGISGAGFTKSSGWGDTANCIYYPATKNQRDTLEMAITNAGYEWNAEKKELRKLSHSKVTKISDQVQKLAESKQETKPNGGIVYEDFNEGDGYYKVNLEYLSKSQVELIENLVDSWQNHANNSVEWSEEDYDKISSIKYLLHELDNHNFDDWFDKIKSLKPQQKQEWSEEDEIGLSDTLWAIQQARAIAKDENDMGNLWYAENWLKDLKDRVYL